MNTLKDIALKKIYKGKRYKTIVKEIFRKLIHMLSAFVPFFVYLTSSKLVIVFLLILLFLFIIFEIARLKSRRLYFFSNIVEIASREGEEKCISLGPITLCFGIIISLYFFPLNIATMAILALSFGDGFASLIGTIFGKKKLIFKGKTREGTLSCLFATFIAELIYTHSFFVSFILAIITSFIELLPLKEFDNILIPIIASLAVKFLF